ncbi:CdaR family protein [Virgibacillus ndiopensis]|uniref:CdaR family protein n=1 Tax=Virgibacillus ndiopensis TaxID=2004408 RepID=UPI000C06E8C9|nr:CdaR family protein [Virgibacillus ndiopensis]
MDNWFKSKWFVRAVSLAFAIVLFIFVNGTIDDPDNDKRFEFPGNSNDLQTVKDVPVDIRIDKNFVVSGVPEFVDVSFEGSESTLATTVKQRNFDIYVDLQGLGDGEHSVEIQYDGVPEELQVYIEPKTIDVVIEERASKEFTVNVDYINMDKLPAGYEIGEAEVNPSTVTITSSKSVVEQIAIVKVFVDVANLTESIDNREVPVNVYDSQGNELNVNVEPQNVEVSAEVDNPSKTVPVHVSTTGELPEGYSLTTISPEIKEVEVFATSETLAGIKDIPTEDIDLSKITESGTLDVGLALPDGVTVPDMETIKVSVELEQTKTIEDIPLEVQNSNDGQEVSFVQPESPSMNITAVGNQQDVSKLSTDDFALSVNVEGLESGEHTIPVTIKGPENITYEGEFKEVTVRIV